MRRLAEQMADMQQAIRAAFEPQWLDAMTRLGDRMRQQTESLQRALASAVTPAFEQWSLQLPKISTAWVEQMRPVFEQLRRSWEEALPPNWEGFDVDEVSAAIERIESTGCCLVWVPRIEIVREVLDADATATKGVLLARRGDILDDALDVLAEVTELQLAPERDSAVAAIKAFRDGHSQAAQALASSVFTSTAHKLFEMGTKAIRRRMAETHPDEAAIAQLRIRTIYLAGARALDEFRPDRATPVRRDFNRHNTAHRITAEQWTDANALSAIMLSAALLRELNVWFSRDRQSGANGTVNE